MDEEPFQHRLTPVPQNETESPWQIDLVGPWQLSPDAPEDVGKRPLAELCEVQRVDVPGSAALQGIQLDPKAWITLEHTLSLPPGWSNRRIMLQAEGIAHEARVWLNGQEVGHHQGAFTPSEWDISEVLGGASKARITVAARDASLANTLSSASAYAAFPLVGIIRPIRLIALPPVHITALRVRTPLSDDLSQGQVNVTVDLQGQSSDEARLLAVLTAPDKQQLTRQEIPLDLSKREHTFSLGVAQPTLWDPEHPNLYKLELTLLTSGNQLEQKHDVPVGLRRIDVDGNRLRVNGHPVKLRGVCRHEIHPLKGRSVPDAFARRDAELFKNANVNFVRCVHYPPSPAFVAACDELGLFVEVEAPVCWAFGSFDKTPRWHQLDDLAQAASRDYILKSTRAMIE